MALKVCQLCAVDFTLQHFLLPLIDGMQSAGWQVTSVCSDGEHVPDIRARGYRVVTVEITRSMNAAAHLKSLWRLWRLFRRERFDVVHVHTPVAALIGRVAAWLSGVPLVVYTAHGFYFHEGMPAWKRRIFVFLEWIGSCFTDLLFTQSQEDAEAAVIERLSSANDVVAIGNGVDAARFDPESIATRDETRRIFGIPDAATVVGIIGRMVGEKGYGEFLAAAMRLGQESDAIYFLVVGSRLSNDHGDSVEHALQEAKNVLGKRLILAGFRRDTPDMLAAMDVFCLPSYREGMPRTIIEAMMMGKPVVATRIRGAREEVIDGVTGILVPTRDVGSLAAVLRELLGDSGRALAMGEAGRQRALEFYDERKVVALQIDKIAAYAKKHGLNP